MVILGVKAPLFLYPWLAPDVMAAMLVYRTIAKKSSKFESIFYVKREGHFAFVSYTNMAV